MVLLRANADDLLSVGLDEVLFKKYKEINPTYTQIFDIRSSDRKYEKITGFSGFGSLVNKLEGEVISYDDPYQGYDTTFTHLTYGLAFRVTMEMQQDDLYDVIKRMPASLAETVQRYKDTQAASILNDAFADTASDFMSGMDGKVLCATDHPLAGGGTYANTITAADLSVTSLEEALYTMRLTVGDRNELIDLQPKYLVIPPQLERVAYELLKSSGRPDTTNRADNWLNTQGLQVIVWNRLSDADTWFLLSEKSRHNLIFYNRMELETDSDRDFNTKDHVYSVITRFSIGWADWRGVFGVAGA
jgi:phage major head subunit gpT-like protein